MIRPKSSRSPVPPGLIQKDFVPAQPTVLGMPSADGNDTPPVTFPSGDGVSELPPTISNHTPPGPITLTSGDGGSYVTGSFHASAFDSATFDGPPPPTAAAPTAAPPIAANNVFSDKEALDYLAARGPIETSRAALARDWGWSSRKAKLRLMRWEVEAKILVEPTLAGRSVISVLPSPEIRKGENAVWRHKERGDRRSPSKKVAAKPEIVVKIRSRPQVIQYSRILIAALEEVVDYDPRRHHNQPPPELRIDDDEYLREIRSLIEELRTLNSLLEANRRKPRQTSGAVVNLTHHVDGFLSSYAKSLGRGAGWLTIAAIGALLYQAGIAQDVI